MNSKLQELKARLLEIYDLQMATSLLRWDQATYMPPGGAPARGRQIALLGRLAHERLTDPEIGRLLDAARARGREAAPSDSDEAALVRVTRREYDQAVRVPAELRRPRSTATSPQSYQAWTEARPANDFASVRPLLEKTLDSQPPARRLLPGYESIADPLIDFSDYGMKARDGARGLRRAARAARADRARDHARARSPTTRACASRPPSDRAARVRRST